ncbi:MAG: Imm10 family immunity protein [Gammaproteobacteria bacterium]|nr:Imm10 family immunity protein [Gammaproteobacteria bacterium]
MVNTEISYKADYVEAISEEFTPEFIVHGIHFGEGDPEQDGQHWNFTRTLETDDDGVCTVKEIQQVTIYGGIKKFVLSRNNLICEFDDKHSERTGVQKLSITFDISDEDWNKLLEKSNLVFSGESYYEVK